MPDTMSTSTALAPNYLGKIEKTLFLGLLKSEKPIKYLQQNINQGRALLFFVSATALVLMKHNIKPSEWDTLNTTTVPETELRFLRIIINDAAPLWGNLLQGTKVDPTSTYHITSHPNIRKHIDGWDTTQSTRKKAFIVMGLTSFLVYHFGLKSVKANEKILTEDKDSSRKDKVSLREKALKYTTPGPDSPRRSHLMACLKKNDRTQLKQARTKQSEIIIKWLLFSTIFEDPSGLEATEEFPPHYKP